jgi:hypothetical protein
MDRMKEEHCCNCDDPTGRAGRADDSLYINDIEGNESGPYCPDCFDAISATPLPAPPGGGKVKEEG